MLAFAEAVSWTLLIAGLLLRAFADMPLATTIGGSIHGFVFISYGATAVLLTFHQRWKPAIGALAIVSAVIPYTTIPVERWLDRRGLLDGPWMLEVPDAPERRWYDQIMVWFLRRPWIFGVLIAALVVVVYVVLLILGPPVPKG